MRDFSYGSYIPDLTERYPEGFRYDYDDPCYGYEPSYDELVEMGEYNNEETQDDDYIHGIFESMDIILNE